MLPILPVAIGLNPVQLPVSGTPAISAPSAATAGAPGKTFSDFTTLLSNAIDAVNGTQAAADTAATNLVTGKSTDVHDVMISMEKAKVTFDLAVQVRNKVLDAYNEMMHTQV